MSRRALVVGSVGLDLVAPTGDSEVARGSAGNSGSNIAIRLSAGGWDVTFVTVVGDDWAGRKVIEDCARWGVDTSGILTDAEYPTPREFIVSGGKQQSELIFACPGCGALRQHPLRIPRADQLTDDLLLRAREADLLVIDVAGPAAVRLATGAPGALVWYEASLFEASSDDQFALGERADALKCSDEEADHFRELFAADFTSTRLRVITGGRNGSRYVTRRDESSLWTSAEIKPRPIVAVDTLGAGDAFTSTAASTLASTDLATRWSAPAVADALAAASQSAAAVCLAVGARGDMCLIDTVSGAERSPWLDGTFPFRCSTCTP